MTETEWKIADWKALDSKVIVVASVTMFPKGSKIAGEWAAYIGAVAGERHSEEWQGVLEHGSKLPYKVAALLFPEFDKKYRWRN